MTAAPRAPKQPRAAGDVERGASGRRRPKAVYGYEDDDSAGSHSGSSSSGGSSKGRNSRGSRRGQQGGARGGNSGYGRLNNKNAAGSTSNYAYSTDESDDYRGGGNGYYRAAEQYDFDDEDDDVQFTFCPETAPRECFESSLVAESSLSRHRARMDYDEEAEDDDEDTRYPARFDEEADGCGRRSRGGGRASQKRGRSSSPTLAAGLGLAEMLECRRMKKGRPVSPPNVDDCELLMGLKVAEAAPASKPPRPFAIQTSTTSLGAESSLHDSVSSPRSISSQATRVPDVHHLASPITASSTKTFTYDHIAALASTATNPAAAAAKYLQQQPQLFRPQPQYRQDDRMVQAGAEYPTPARALPHLGSYSSTAGSGAYHLAYPKAVPAGSSTHDAFFYSDARPTPSAAPPTYFRAPAYAAEEYHHQQHGRGFVGKQQLASTAFPSSEQPNTYCPSFAPPPAARSPESAADQWGRRLVSEERSVASFLLDMSASKATAQQPQTCAL